VPAHADSSERWCFNNGRQSHEVHARSHWNHGMRPSKNSNRVGWSEAAECSIVH
jgi:hypothetical protein